MGLRAEAYCPLSGNQGSIENVQHLIDTQVQQLRTKRGSLPDERVPELQTNRGKLPVNWAQQLTGADLVEVSGSQVGLIDTQANHHFESVASVFQSSSNADIVFRANFEEMEDFKSFKVKVDAAKAEGKLPRFIGISFAMGSNEDVKRSLEYLRENGSIIVASAGNHGNDELHPNNQLPGIINVGSVGVDGLMDSYSQVGAISAPVGNEIAIKMNGNLFTAGGTSYAQPQVLAAFADVEAYLPGITEGEIQVLMEYTSLPGINGPILNHLKMVEVAKRLSREKNWPMNRAELLDPKSRIYDFREEAQTYAASTSSSRDLRRAYLLDPKNDHIRRELIQSLREEGNGNMAEFFESLNPDPNEKRQYLSRKASAPDPDIRLRAQRNLRSIQSEEADSIWAQLLAEGKSYIKRESLNSLALIPPRKFSPALEREILKSLQEGDERTQLMAWEVIRKHNLHFIEVLARIPFQAAWSNKKSEIVRQMAVLAAAPYASVLKPPLITLTMDPDPRVAKTSLEIALEHTEIGDDPFIPFLERARALPTSSDEYSQLLVNYDELKSLYREKMNLVKIRGVLIDLSSQSRFLEVRQAAIESLERLGQSQYQVR